MKVLFVVSGIGYGDAMREHCNIQELKKKYPLSKIMVAGYDHSYDYFKEKYDTIRIIGYKLPGESMNVNAFNFVLKNILLPWYWFFGTLKVRLKAYNFIPDVVISDFEPAGISLAEILGKKCIVVFGFDPLLYKEYKKNHKVNMKMKVQATYFEKLYNLAEMVVIPTFKKDKEQHLIYTYINPIIRTEPKELPSENYLMKSFGLKKKPIILILGGSNFGMKLAKNINLIAAENKNEEFIIFGGDLDFKLNDNVRYIKFTDDILKYMKIAKGVITLGGQKTLSEAMVYGKPVLCFPIQNHIEQLLNAYALEDVLIVSHDSSLNAVRKNFNLFLKKIPELNEKVAKRNFSSNGSKQFLDIFDLIIK